MHWHICAGGSSERKHTHGRWQCPKQFVKVEFVENLVFLQCICNVRLSSILEFGTMGFSTWQLSLPPCISRLAWRNSVDKVLLSSVTCNFIHFIQLGHISELHFLGLCQNLRLFSKLPDVDFTTPTLAFLLKIGLFLKKSDLVLFSYFFGVSFNPCFIFEKLDFNYWWVSI